MVSLFAPFASLLAFSLFLVVKQPVRHEGESEGKSRGGLATRAAVADLCRFRRLCCCCGCGCRSRGRGSCSGVFKTI